MTSTPTGLRTAYEFDAAFQTKIAALMIRDTEFLSRTEGLVKPEHFQSSVQGVIVDQAIRFHEGYKVAPALATLVKLLKDAVTSKAIRADIAADIRPALHEMLTADLSDKEYVIDEVAAFARHQETAKAILDSVDLLEKRDFVNIEKKIRTALEVGTLVDIEEYDLFEKIHERTRLRQDVASGLIKPTGITTGFPQMDAVLYHNGWGREELSLIMGGAKSGKTTALIGFAVMARMAGHNVLYCSHEVSRQIISDRADANISGTMMRELKNTVKIGEVEDVIAAAKTTGGKFIIHEFPSGTCRPMDVRRLLKHYAAKGIIFDMVVQDYADIMQPDVQFKDKIENSKSIFLGLRALASEFKCAMLTATQTNREGFVTATRGTAKAEHVADDFNKIRICDVVISINQNDDEKARNEARLFFAASRNQESGMTLTVKQDIQRMRFIVRILTHIPAGGAPPITPPAAAAATAP